MSGIITIWIRQSFGPALGHARGKPGDLENRFSFSFPCSIIFLHMCIGVSKTWDANPTRVPTNLSSIRISNENQLWKKGPVNNPRNFPPTSIAEWSLWTNWFEKRTHTIVSCRLSVRNINYYLRPKLSTSFDSVHSKPDLWTIGLSSLENSDQFCILNWMAATNFYARSG